MTGNIGQQAFKSAKNNTEILQEIVNNISNTHSVGYKKSTTTFSETLNGEIVKNKTTDFSQGMLRKTGEVFDIAIKGKGFFEVELPNGNRAYTRVGRFALTGDGEIVTQEGYRVLPEIEESNQTASKNGKDFGLNLSVSTPKLIVPSNMTPLVEEDGLIYGIDDATGEKKKLGKLSLSVFNNPQGLESVSKSYYVKSEKSGEPIELKAGVNESTQIKQGFIEGSNVDTATTFMALTQVRNMLSANLKVLKAIDKIYESIHYTISRNA